MKAFIIFATMTLLVSCAPKVQEDSVVPGSELGFSVKVFRNALRQSAPDENVTVSPYSAGVALSMLAEGAEGQTRTELDNALGGCLFRKAELGDGDTVTVKSANSVWINDDFSVRNTYVDLLSKEYGAFADVMDFSDPSTVHAINNWCSENTEGMIKGIVNKLTPQMVMVLANALYFKAPWENPFDPASTAADVFHGSKGDADIPFMNGTLTCGYVDYAGNTLVSIPYKGGRYSMYIMLPSKDIGVNGVVSYMSEGGLKDVMSHVKNTRVRLSMPKFKVGSEMSLVKTLEAMGVRTAFTSAADLSGIARGPLSVSDVYQKAVVDVDEKGSEAAAVTTVTVSLTSARVDQVPSVVIDRPFLYMIADLEADRILFAGKIMNL